MEINEEKEEKIVNFGVFGYNVQKMSNILDIDKKEVEKEMINTQSKYFLMYQKGKDLADYVIDLKLFDMARDGDMKAMDKLEYRKKQRSKQC